MTDSQLEVEESAISRLADSWRQCLQSASPEVSSLVQGLGEHRSAFGDVFYATLLDDPRAARFLSVDQVRERLHPGLGDWLVDLLGAQSDNVEELIATNLHVGVVHARIGIPVDLVNRGTRVLREAMLKRLAGSGASTDTVFGAISLVNSSLDLALESMTLAYTDAQDRSARADATYRLFSLAHNIGTERERQRALLLDWENNLLYALASNNPAGMPGLLADSEFGLWLLHKGFPIIGQTDETRHVRRLVEEIDDLLETRQEAARLEPAAVEAIRKHLATIRTMLASMLERIGELEAGSDTLTRLLTRRFLPTVLRREIELADTHGHQFALVVLDLDHFKDINDTHGHEMGDRVLQHVAHLLTQSVRSSDYVFRLGGEEFLIVLVGTALSHAVEVAEELRGRIRERPLVVADGKPLQVTASIGVAAYDGHPDYEPLLARADEAMYEAKRNGRDRVEVGRPGSREKKRGPGGAGPR